MTSKFANFTNKFDEIREKLQKQRQAQESSKTKGTFDNSWKFQPKMPKGVPRINFKIRILPNVHEPDKAFPWQSGLFHMFRKSDGQFIYLLCPSHLDNKADKVYHKCPFCEKAKALFETQDKLDEEMAHAWYKKKRFFVNVLVLEDSRAAEENQKGQILIFEYGKKVQDKFEDAIGDQGLPIFDPLNGHDFNLVIKKQGDQTNYDSSSFVIAPSPIAKTEDEMNRIFDGIHNIHEKVFARGPLSYDKLVLKMSSKQEDKIEKTEVVDPTENIDDVVSEKPVENTKAEDTKVAKQDKVEKISAKSTPKTEVKVEAKSEDDDFDFKFDE